MLGIDRHAARITWTVFLIALLILVTWLARESIIVFTLAVFFAYMLWPVVNMVQRFAPRRFSRELSLAVVYILLVACIIGITIGIGSTVAEQAANLAEELPKLVQAKDPLATLPLPAVLDPIKDRIVSALREQLANLDKDAFPLIKQAAGQLLAHASSILFVVLIPILSFFFLKDGPAIREALVTWTSDRNDSNVLDTILDDIHAMLGHYIRALVILSLATFASYTLFLQISGGRYAILLGGIAAALEFIPVAGPLTAAVIIVLVEGFAGHPHLIWVPVFVVVYRLFQDYVLSPYLMGAGVELHPLLVLFGVLAGEQIGGVPGMFFSVPVLAALRVIYVRLERDHKSRPLTLR